MSASEQVKRLGKEIEAAMDMFRAAAQSEEIKRVFREATGAMDNFCEACRQVESLFATQIDGRTAEEVEAVMAFWRERGYELRPDGFYRYLFKEVVYHNGNVGITAGKRHALITSIRGGAVVISIKNEFIREIFPSIAEARLHFLRMYAPSEYAFSFEDGCKQMEISEVPKGWEL